MDMYWHLCTLCPYLRKKIFCKLSLFVDSIHNHISFFLFVIRTYQSVCINTKYFFAMSTDDKGKKSTKDQSEGDDADKELHKRKRALTRKVDRRILPLLW